MFGRALYIAIFACVLFSAGACRDSLTEPESNELIEGVRFGMTSQEFFDHCRVRNQEGTMNSGLDNLVRVTLPDSLYGTSAAMEFYPDFDDQQSIVGLKGRIFVDAWAPWNAKYSGDSILMRGAAYLNAEIGGKPLKELTNRSRPIYLKADGNRRFYARAHPSSEQYVQFGFDDLNAESAVPRNFSDITTPAAMNPILEKSLRQ